MDEATVNKILERLDALSEISVQGFDILVQQVFYDGVKYTLWALIWLIISVLISWAASKTYKGVLLQDLYTFQTFRNGERSFNKLWSILYGMAAITTLFVSFHYFTQALLRFINPEFYAIEYIFGRI